MKRRAAFHVLAAVAASCLLAACSPQKPAFNAIDITGATYAQDFALPDTSGQVRRIQDFKGKVVVVFFGYTQCPDACPTTMAELAEVKRQLGADGDKLQGVFVSIDPERDTPAVLKAYMENFDPSFIALTTTPDKLVTVARDYKVYYKKVDGKTPTSYTMDHSVGSYIYDPQGRVRLYTRNGAGTQALAADLRALLQNS